MRLDHLLSKEQHFSGSRTRELLRRALVIRQFGSIRPRSSFSQLILFHHCLRQCRQRVEGTTIGTTGSRTCRAFTFRCEGASLGPVGFLPAGRGAFPRPSPVTDSQSGPSLVGRAAASLENCRASTSIYISSKSARRNSQAIKSQRWMPWRQMPMKDVDGCEKPRGAAYQALIRGYLNGETRLGSCSVTPA